MRCLVQVQSFTTMPKSARGAGNDMTEDTQTAPLLVGVELEGVAVHNSFTNNIGYNPFNFAPGSTNTSQLIGAFPTTLSGHTARIYVANRSITDDGVLISTPFGKRLRVRVKNMTTNDL